MKKVFSILLVLAMLVCFMATSAHAAEGGVSGTSTTATTGSETTVNFTVSHPVGFYSYKIYVYYDAAKLSNPVVSNGVVANTATSGKIVVTFYNIDNITSNTFSVTFTVNGDCSAPHSVSADIVEFFRVENGKNVEMDGNDGSATITVNHTYGTGVVTKPTCTEAGYTTYTCSVCGHSYTDAPVAALDHDYQVVKAEVKPTCTEKGKTAVETCSRCGVSKGGDEINPLNHAYGTASYNWSADGKSCTATRTCANDASHVETATATVTSAVTTPATCKVKGTTTYTATFAEDWAATQTKDVQDIPVLDHTYDQKVVEDAFKKSDATCTAKAVYYFSCSCGEKGTATFETGDLKAHTPGAAATCTTAQICTVCQKELAAKLGHNLKDTAYKAPTCEGEGVEDGKECTRCDYVEGKKVIPALGHDYEGVVTKEPTCEDKGVKTYTCKNDSKHTYTEDIKALGHKWDKGVVTKKATCTTEGEMTYTCQNDKTHTKTEKIKALGHDIDSEKYGSDSKGNHWLICNTCGEIASEKVPHNFNVKGTDGYWYCVCGAKGDKIETDTGKDEQPKNGDITPYFVMGVATLVAMSAAVVYVDKKRKTR